MSDTREALPHRRNFLANVADGALFFGAMALVTANTVIAAFVKQLGGSNTLVALAPSVTIVGWLLPQLFVANYVETMPRKKPYVLVTGLIQRLAWIVSAAILWLFGTAHPGWVLWSFLVLYFLSGVASGLCSPAWMDMVAKITPVNQRGRLFAWRIFLGNLFGMASGWIIARVLGAIAFPGSYSALFVLTFILLMLSWWSVAYVHEPSSPSVRPMLQMGAYMRRLPVILRENRPFALFTLSSLFLAAGSMAMAFCTVDALERFHLPQAATGTFTFLLTAGQALGTFAFGRLGDSIGHKANLILGGLFAAVAYLLAALSAPLAGYYVLFVLLGLSIGAAILSRSAIVVEFGTPEERPTYVGLSNTVQAPIVLGVPFVGGWMADAYGYPAVFTASFFLTLLGTGIILAMRDPRNQVAPLTLAQQQ